MSNDDTLSGSLAEAENWLRRVAEIVDPVAGSRKALVLQAEYRRLKAIETALGPVMEKWVWLDPDDLDDIARATSVEWVKSVEELVRVAAIVVRGPSA
jgi:hypothetical protein